MQDIRESVESIAQVREKVAFGFKGSDSSSFSSDSEVDTEFQDDSDHPYQAIQQETTLPELVLAIHTSSFNWSELINQFEERNIDPASAEILFEALLGELSPEECKLTAQSHEAFLHMEKVVMPEEE